MIYEHEVKHGVRIRCCGPVDDGHRPDVTVGTEGRAVVTGGEKAIDGTGDMKVVWDDVRLNDQNRDYEPGSDASWLYFPAIYVELATPLDLSDLDKIEEFLHE